MSTFDFIIGVDDSLNLETDYFVAQLKSRWRDAHVHFIDDENAHSLLQWRIDTGDIYILGDFSPGGITFQAHSDPNFAQVVLWYRRIVPPEHRLVHFKDSLTTLPFEVTPDMTAEEIIKASQHEFDDDEFQRFIDSMPDGSPFHSHH